MKRSIIGIVALSGALLGTISTVSAEQYVRHINGKEVVVHTNAAPVVLHRLVPPYLGKHVTARQVNSGRLPAGLRK